MSFRSFVTKASLSAIGAILALAGSVSSVNAEEKFFGVKYDPAFTQITHFDADEPYEVPKAFEHKHAMGYMQPYDGYCNKSDLPADIINRLPCQTANIKTTARYLNVQGPGNKWMHRACDEALKSVQNGGGPFGTVIVQIDDDTNRVIRYWCARNSVAKWVDPTAHGEVTGIRQACQELGVFNLGHIEKSNPSLKLPQNCAISHCELYTSAEPCSMCYTATRWARIDHIYFAATVLDAAAQGVNFSDEPIYNEIIHDYIDRRGLGVYALQLETDNSLSAFNHYKRSNAPRY